MEGINFAALSYLPTTESFLTISHVSIDLVRIVARCNAMMDRNASTRRHVTRCGLETDSIAIAVGVVLGVQQLIGQLLDSHVAEIHVVLIL